MEILYWRWFFGALLIDHARRNVGAMPLYGSELLLPRNSAASTEQIAVSLGRYLHEYYTQHKEWIIPLAALGSQEQSTYFLGYFGFTHCFEKGAEASVKEAFLLKCGNPLCACCSERVRITGTVGGFSPPGVFEQKQNAT